MYFHLRTAVVTGFFLWHVVAGLVGSRGQDVYSSQKLLSAPSKKYAAPVKSLDGLIYTINVTIGTPPQGFNVSLNPSDSSFFIPSAECGYHCIGMPHVHRYNHTESTTYERDGTYASHEFWDVRYSGHLVRDTVRIGDLAITNETFIEYDRQSVLSIAYWEDDFDGMLGLAPPWHKHPGIDTPVHYAGLLEALSADALLDENVFSLALPRHLEDEGEIMFGGTNPDLYTGEFKSVKVVEDDTVPFDFLKGLWSIPISGLTINTSVPYHWPLDKYIATIVDSPIIDLPRALARDLREIIGAEPFNPVLDSIPCDRRPYLPELTFTIGGHNLTITAYDYIFEFLPVLPGYGPTCLVWLSEDWRRDSDGNNVNMLGSTFLKGLYTVFDFEHRELRFAEMNRSRVSG